MRVFIAADLPESIRAALGQQQAEFQGALGKASRDLGARWTNPEGIHLTLKFLGHIQDTEVKQVTEALAGLGSFDPFQVEVRGFGCFPSPGRPRVLWAGVEAPPDLAQLAGRIEDSMEHLGFAREQREFNPHLTLARFKNPHPQQTLRALVDERRELLLGRLEVSDYFLFESKLHPSGAEYRKVMRFPQ